MVSILNYLFEVSGKGSDKVSASKFPRYKWVNPKIIPVQQPKVNINKLPPDPGTNPQLDPRYRFN